MLRHRQRRKDAATHCMDGKKRKMGPTILSWTGEFPSQKDGMQVEYLEYEQFRGPQMKNKGLSEGCPGVSVLADLVKDDSKLTTTKEI